MSEQPLPPRLDDELSLRDYMAAQALVGIIASFSGADVALPKAEWTAQTAYDYAAAMLRERSRRRAVPESERAVEMPKP